MDYKAVVLEDLVSDKHLKIIIFSYFHKYLPSDGLILKRKTISLVYITSKNLWKLRRESRTNYQSKIPLVPFLLYIP